MARTALSSATETIPPLRSLRFRFLDFEVRIWLRKADARFIFPVEVTRNRFRAPLRLFILGMRHYSCVDLSAFCSLTSGSADFCSVFFFRSGISSMTMLRPSNFAG